MSEDDPDGIKEDIVASKNPAGHDLSMKSQNGRVYPPDENFRLNFHIDNSILSNHSEEHCPVTVGKGRGAHSKLSEFLDQRICCRETIATLKRVYNIEVHWNYTG